MSPKDLLSSLQQRPFVPFRIYLSDGTSHEVRHPEMIYLGIRTSILNVPDRNDPDNADQTIKIDNLHITKTETLTNASF